MYGCSSCAALWIAAWIDSVTHSQGPSHSRDTQHLDDHSAEQPVAGDNYVYMSSAEQPDVILYLVLDSLTPFSMPI